MEDTFEAQDVCTEFEDGAYDLDEVADVRYYGRMVEVCRDFLDDTMDDLLKTLEKKDWDRFLEYRDVQELRQIYDAGEPDMYVEDVENALRDSTYKFVERAKDVEELEKLLSEEWDPRTQELYALRDKYRSECERICERIAAKVEAHYEG